MKSTKILVILVMALGLMVWLAEVGEAAIMGTAFTYQGRLIDANSAADGEYDFAFKLYDANVAGIPVANDVNVANVDVIDGYFTVELDFGSDVFDGSAVWLEIGVRPGELEDPNVYTTLSPRQEVTAVPYALQTRGIFVDSGGNIGIGTTSPSSRLDVYGGTISNIFQINSGIGTNQPLRVFSRGPQLYVADFDDNSSGSYFSWRVDGEVLSDEIMRLTEEGRLGIGTTNPRTDLEIEGTTGLRVTTGQHSNVFGEFKHAYSGGLLINANAGGGWADMSLQTDNTTRLFIESGGNVGIGTTSPLASLVVAGTGTTMVKTGYKGSYNNAESGRLAFDEDVDQSGTCGFEFQHDGSANKLYLNGGCTTMSPIVTFTRGGNVGIGTDSPAEKLTVRGGNLLIEKADGTDIVELGEGLDYAEGFDVAGSTEIGPGAVLIIDPDNAGKLAVSNTVYDSKVAGIVAGAKGMGSGVRLGAGGFDYDVALAGRVYCNVDAAEAAVEPGDLLTTSATPGYAMKATDYTRAQGAILGKAMERLEQGQKGQILVLVSLQ